MRLKQVALDEYRKKVLPFHRNARSRLVCPHIWPFSSPLPLESVIFSVEATDDCSRLRPTVPLYSPSRTTYLRSIPRRRIKRGGGVSTKYWGLCNIRIRQNILVKLHISVYVFLKCKYFVQYLYKCIYLNKLSWRSDVDKFNF